MHRRRCGYAGFGCFALRRESGVPSKLRINRTAASASELGAEGVFVEADCGGVAGLVVDGENVEATGTIRNVALGEKALRGTGDQPLFVGGDA
jgi:hypothetical protein